MTSLMSRSRVVVTGQIGCGKSTLAGALASRLGLVHVRLDQFNGQDDAMALAATAVAGIPGGWVVDGCVWQVPDAAWNGADVIVHLDYANAVHYRRIIWRALRRVVSADSIKAARTAIVEEREHLTIMRRYADENRRSWSKAGGITQAPTPVIRCRRPREARILLAQVCPSRQRP